MTMTLWELERAVIAEVQERKAELLDGDASDTLAEIADSHVPIYYTDLASCLMSDTSLSECEDSGLVAGVTDVWKIISMAIYERLMNTAHGAHDDLESESEAVQA